MAAPSPFYSFPGDSCWPSAKMRSDFNKTVGGRLMPTVPLASVCHKDETYNPNVCEILKSNWFLPKTYLPSSSSSVMAALFTNNSCNPFLQPEIPCTLGNYVNYAVKIRDTSNAQKTLAFAKKHHVRLVIRNTDHDYNGKSTGAGGLAIWTQNIKNIELLEAYSRPWYKGRALKISTGVLAYEAYKFADAHQGTVVGGNCPTVGIAEEVITAAPSDHGDLSWALCGGGPGTYGIALSMTAKLHSSIGMSSTKLSFAIPSRGLQVTWTLVPGALVVSPATAPELPKQDIDKHFQPTLSQLIEDGIPYAYHSQEFSTFLISHEAMILPCANVSDSILSGQLLPRSVVRDHINEFIPTVRMIVEAHYLFVGLSLDVSQISASKVAASPYWRKTLISARFMTNTLIPKLTAFTGGKGAAYLNKANFLPPNWQDVFYGKHYSRLSSIKLKYDPKSTFYALGAVGSEGWAQKPNGRLWKA
ncbi:FAD-binding domain-containing protein [Lentithecium fluviatile CBS 122367]|uniref:FAD-binding domain-containing protein n=1 Tax=Lentithecium fluviatile CBS 122367 TaxID=1168545 RepID=A0A6G1J0A2_9PLEO|nr:FAD-binding domain-containing protein [Lentithecium fluviatile CBS 122367]